MTTPHGSKPGASGMTLVCRPTPIVRFMHMSETRLKATHVSHGTQNIGTLVLLPEGTIYLGTPKHYLVVSVQENMHILAQGFKKCKLVFRLRAARLISPWLKPGALRRDLVNALCVYIIV